MNKNNYYRLYWKNEEFGSTTFELCGVFETIDEARAVINERRMGKAELYKIVEVKDEVEINVDYSTQNYSLTGIGEEF